MNFFRQLKIATKLGLGFFSLLALMTVLGLMALSQMSKVNDQSTDIAKVWMPSINFINQMNTATSDYRIAELQHVLASKPEQMAKFEQDMQSALATINKNRDSYAALIVSDEETRLLQQFDQLFKRYQTIHEEMVGLSRQMKTEEAMQLLNGESLSLFNEYSAILLKLVDLNVSGGDKASDLGDEIYASAQSLITSIIGVAVVLGILIAVVIVRGLLRQIGGEPAYAADVVNRVAAGDLTLQVQLLSLIHI